MSDDSADAGGAYLSAIRVRSLSCSELKALFEARDLDPNAPQVHFCASGNRAALTWFASYALFGNEKAKLYDGSMDQWGPRNDLPIEQRIKLCASC